MNKIDMKITKYNDFRSSEAYKVVRTNLMFSASDIKAIVFTSTTENEGKSTVSWNLAISFAESGKKVLYLDADMRKSVFSGRNRISNRTEGLSHFLSGQSTLEDILYSTDVDNLFVILPGVFPPNPAELLSSPLFGELINKLKEVFDYIIIDTPPIISAIDAAIVTAVCDASVIVISYNGNSRKLISLTVDQLKKTGKPILGAILNKFRYNSISPYDKYYSKYYGKYEGQQNKKPTKLFFNAKVKLSIVLLVLLMAVSAFALFTTGTKDKVAPQITFTQDPVYYQGDDTSVLLTGVLAADDMDGSVTSSIVIDRVVDNADGTLTVTYAAKDSANNVTKLSRVVTVHQLIAPVINDDVKKNK